jgi:hypothetical protein
MGKDIHYETPVRFAELNFTRFVASYKYRATICQLPVSIDRLTADLAVVRLQGRFDGADPHPCKLVISDGSGIKYASGKITFIRREVSIYEVSPSFYIGAAPGATRVTIVGAGLNVVKTVALTRVTGTPCTDIVVSAAGDTLSCTLPTFAADEDPDPMMTLYLFNAQDVDVGFFQVEIIKPESVSMTTVSPTTFTSGTAADVTLTLDKPLSTLARLPWAPVLVSAAGEAVSSDVTVTNVAWAADGKTLTFKLTCSSCVGTYRFALGESNNLAAALISGAIDVTFTLPECGFKIGDTFPPTVSAPATAAKATTFYIPLHVEVRPEIKVALSVGGVVAATTVTQIWPKANVVEVVLQAALPVGKATWTWEMTNEARGTTTKCTVSDAFEVVAAADGAPYISSTSPHVFFKHDVPATVFISGVGLDKATAATVQFRGAAAAVSCTDFFVRSATEVECVMPSTKIKPGVATVTLSDAAGAVVASASVFGAELTATVAPESAKTETATTVDIAFASELPALAPWKLALKPHNGEPLVFQAVWASALAAQFAGVKFPAGSADVFVDLMQNGHVAMVLGHVQIPDGPGPEPKPKEVRAVPATYFMPSTTASAAKFRLFSDDYAEVESNIGSVHFNERSATVLMTTPHLIVELDVNEALVGGKDAIDVEVFGKDGKTLLKTVAAVKIDRHTGKIIPATTNTVAFAAEGEAPRFKFAFHEAPEEGIAVTSSYGPISSKVSYSFQGVTYFDLTFATPCAGCDGKAFTVTFDFSHKNKPETEKDVFVVDMQVVASPKLVDLTPREFDFSQGGCVTYSAVVEALSAEVPLQLFVKDNPGLSVENVRINAAHRIFTGCFVCKNCATGTFEVSVGAAYDDEMSALDFPDFKITVPHESPEPTPGGGGGLGGDIIALIVVGSAAVVSAVVYLIYRAYKKKSQRHQNLGSQRGTYLSMA